MGQTVEAGEGRRSPLFGVASAEPVATARTAFGPLPDGFGRRAESCGRGTAGSGAALVGFFAASVRTFTDGACPPSAEVK